MLILLFSTQAIANERYSGRKVTLMVPDGLEYAPGKYRGFSMTWAEVEDDGRGGVRIAGRDWQGTTFPRSRVCYAYGEFTVRNEPDRIRMSVACDGKPIHFIAKTSQLPAAQKMFDQFVAPGEPNEPAAKALRAASRRRIAETLFANALAPLNENGGDRLLELLQGLGVSGITTMTYRDAPYLQVDFGTSETVFNTIQLNRTQRVSRVITEQLLRAARSVEEWLKGITAIEGVALMIDIPYSNFVTKRESGVDEVELFIPRAELVKLMGDEISSQQLVAGSIIRVNGNRFDVDLTQ